MYTDLDDLSDIFIYTYCNKNNFFEGGRGGGGGEVGLLDGKLPPLKPPDRTLTCWSERTVSRQK